jgi:dihydroxyacid dehydratase/phosphogluconate dehydratase
MTAVAQPGKRARKARGAVAQQRDELLAALIRVQQLAEVSPAGSDAAANVWQAIGGIRFVVAQALEGACQ